MIAVVTGASGHIGANLVRALLEEGARVRALIHRDERALAGLELERVRGDILDPDSLTRAFTGADRVYHLAGHIAIVSSEARRLQEINVEGTRNVVQAALRCGVSRLVYTSSVEALLTPACPEPIDESGDLDPAGLVTPYGRSKVLAERAVRAGIAQGLDAVVVLPSAVVGPLDFKGSHFGQVFMDFALGRLPAWVGGGFNLVDVRDVARGILLAAERGRCGERYLLCGRSVSMDELARVLEESTGHPRPAFLVPLWLARFGALFTPLYYRWSGRQPQFTRQSLALVARDPALSSTKAQTELGFAPGDPLDGVRSAVAWFQQTGRLPRHQHVFRSRRDPGLVALIGFFLLVCLAGGLTVMCTGSGSEVWLGLGAMLLGSGYAWLTVPVRYRLADSVLEVRSGPFRWRIPVDSVTRVRPSRMPLSAPAWSLRRLRLDYRKDGKPAFVLISPSDRERFLEELARAAPQLERTGQCLSATDVEG